MKKQRHLGNGLNTWERHELEDLLINIRQWMLNDPNPKGKKEVLAKLKEIDNNMRPHLLRWMGV